MRVPSAFRANILGYASRITADCQSPAAVEANAGPLLEFLENATGTHDMAARLEALRRHDANLSDAWVKWNERSGEPDPRPMDDPHRFVADAMTYYTFIAAPHVA